MAMPQPEKADWVPQPEKADWVPQPEKVGWVPLWGNGWEPAEPELKQQAVPAKEESEAG